MKTIALEPISARTQRTYARLAGFLFLWLIATALTGMFVASRIAGSGTFGQQAQRIAASEHLYRAALCSELIETLSALLLGFALYVTLRPVNKFLAQLAMFWRFSESVIGCVGMVIAFSRVNIYLAAQPSGELAPDHAQALLDFTRYLGRGTFNISALCFSLGSVLFFYLFYRSAYIPRLLSAFGVFASVIVTIICFGGLIFPEYAARLRYGWAPMAIAEVVTGFWLMFAVKIPAREVTQSPPAALLAQ